MTITMRLRVRGLRSGRAQKAVKAFGADTCLMLSTQETSETGLSKGWFQNCGGVRQ